MHHAHQMIPLERHLVHTDEATLTTYLTTMTLCQSNADNASHYGRKNTQ